MALLHGRHYEWTHHEGVTHLAILHVGLLQLGEAAHDQDSQEACDAVR